VREPYFSHAISLLAASAEVEVRENALRLRRLVPLPGATFDALIIYSINDIALIIAMLFSAPAQSGLKGFARPNTLYALQHIPSKQLRL
jgi:hypothetical protein